MLLLSFNLSLSSGSFADLWKKAKVSPLFKEGSLFDRSGYRPISVLAILSKILEHHIRISFYNFFTENDLLSDFQFGFRKSRSCELAVTDLIDRLLNNMDNRVLNGLLLVDLKEAFDLVNHSILLKLQIYGCSSSTVQWFTSSLSDRSQCTNFKGTLFDPLPVSIGVPQGSILCPLFFLLFINGLPLFLPQNTTLTMFTDDTSITQSSSTIHELNARLNLVVSGVFAWANLNDTALNTSKTKSILITIQQKFHRLNDHSFDVMINGKLIEQVEHAKLLGVTLCCHLTWEKHIENICSIVNSRLSLLREGSNRFSIITVLYVSSILVFITSLSIVRVHGVIVPIIYCLVFFSFRNVRLDCSLMPTTLNHL